MTKDFKIIHADSTKLRFGLRDLTRQLQETINHHAILYQTLEAENSSLYKANVQLLADIQWLNSLIDEKDFDLRRYEMMEDAADAEGRYAEWYHGRAEADAEVSRMGLELTALRKAYNRIATRGGAERHRLPGVRGDSETRSGWRSISLSPEGTIADDTSIPETFAGSPVQTLQKTRYSYNRRRSQCDSAGSDYTDVTHIENEAVMKSETASYSSAEYSASESDDQGPNSLQKGEGGGEVSRGE
jgi:hypothetical protein